MEKRKFSWKEALLLVLVLAVAAGVYFYAKTRPKGAEAVIEQDGEVYRRVVLADLKEPLILFELQHSFFLPFRLQRKYRRRQGCWN